jgi:hypothetical protein
MPLAALRKRWSTPAARNVDIVAVLFLLTGITAIGEAIRTKKIEILPGVFGAPIGIGLLRYRNGWRIAALVCLWITMAICAVVGVAALITGDNSVAIKGIEGNPRVIGALFIVIGVGMSYWQFRVLTRPNVRRSFELEGAERP